MTERYVQLMQDLQYSKRQYATCKQKQVQSQIQIQSLKNQNKELNKTIEKLRQSNHKLTTGNRQLIDEKQSIISEYSTEMSNIKEEISNKQKEIIQLRDIFSPAKVDQQLAIRQMKLELSQQYAHLLDGKDRKIQELSAQLDKINYEKELQRQKSKITIQSLQNSARQMQLRHDAQILEYSNKLYLQAQNKPNEDKDYLRRTKKDNEQLKRKLELMSQELSQVLQEKNKVHKDYSTWMNQYKKIVSDHQNQTQLYKNEIERLKIIAEKQSCNRDGLIIKDKEREIKRLKAQMEELRDDIIAKDRRLSDLQIQKVKLINQINVVASEKDKTRGQLQQFNHSQKQRLTKQLRDAYTALDRARAQNLQLTDTVHKQVFELNNVTQKHTKQMISHKNQENISNRLKRQLSQSQLYIVPIVNENRSYEKEHKPKIQNIEETSTKDQTKIKEVLVKYVELKKKYDNAEKKLKKANQKIVQLLQNKIMLGSPKINRSKEFNYPTEDKTNIKVSPPKGERDNLFKHHHFQYSNQQLSFENNRSPSPGHFQTSGQFYPHHKDQNPHSKTNPGLNRDFCSPQPNNRHIRIEDQHENEHSFYERSLKLKSTNKFRELKCANHEEIQQGYLPNNNQKTHQLKPNHLNFH